MNGALMKAASRFAIAASAGLVMSMSSAWAADLGGNCCADLEERVAELEATTARKGNRKMGLTVYGQVDRMILWFDDGSTSKTYWGVDNTNSSSRFGFRGDAKVTPKVKMGFNIEVEIEAGGTSSKLNQIDEDGKYSSSILTFSNSVNAGSSTTSFNQGNIDSMVDMRLANWWIEHADIGRVTVGRQLNAGAVTTIDLAGISLPASSSFANLNGGFFIRDSSGAFTSMTWANVIDPAMDSSRYESLRYDSPSIAGFILSADIGEAGDVWGVMLRYAGEFSGFRVAAGIGYEQSKDRDGRIIANSTANPTSGAYDVIETDKPDNKQWGASLALMHVPTGLFVQGHYLHFSYDSSVKNAWYGDTTRTGDKPDASDWLVQAGIAKNWFGLGNTALYGEYGRAKDFGGMTGGRDYNANAIACNGVACAPPLGVDVADVVGTDVRVWGLGITQNVDAAATTFYLGWRNFDLDVTQTGATRNSFKDLDVVVGGARVSF
jgi:hypothetical protein